MPRTAQPYFLVSGEQESKVNSELKTDANPNSKFGKLRYLLLPVSLVSIVDGLMKLWKHFFSKWRFVPLDYLVGAGAVFVGLLSMIILVKPFKSRAAAVASLVFVIVSIDKIITDFRDPFDILLSLIAMGLGSFVIWASVR